jgi:uncharacterized membrane protein YccC
MTDRQAYEEKAETELEAFDEQIERARERRGEAAAEEEEMLAAVERIRERAQETLDRMKEMDDPEAWDAVRFQMDGILSEMRNAARTVGLTLPD